MKAHFQIPKYQWGQAMQAAVDLHNDGSHPQVAAEDLLARQGSPCEIVNVGAVQSTGHPVYLVEFEDQLVVGVLENEILPREN